MQKAEKTAQKALGTISHGYHCPFRAEAKRIYRKPNHIAIITSLLVKLQSHVL